MKTFAVTATSPAKKSNAVSLGAKFKKGKDAQPSADAVPAFKLYDTYKNFDFRPRRKFSKIQPRIHFFGVSSPAFPPDPIPPSSDDPLDASAIAGRLKALQAALDDIPKQAHRMAREEKRRETVEAGPGKVPPLRPGYAPGHKQRPKHEVDFILHECQALACDVREAPT